MGAIAKGVTSLFGGRKRRREQKAANKEFGAAKQALQDFEFQNTYEGIEAQQAAAGGYEAATRQAGTLGPAAQASVASLGDFQGYDATGYNAAQAQAAQADQINLGEGTGRTNQFENLQVNTAAAQQQAQEADQSLAASQDLAAQAGTGAGGVTALAAAALKSKQGVSASIGAQEAQNAQLRAQGATSIQQENLAQRNLSRQTDISQNQFNTGLQQQTRLANVAAQNQASQFGASAQNQAAQFGANAANQFSLQQFQAQNNLEVANVAAQNQFARAQFGAGETAGAANIAAQNRAAEFGASATNQASLRNAQAANQFALAEAGGAAAAQQQQYGQVADLFDVAGNRKAAADQARNQATADLVGGIVGGVGAAASGGLLGAGGLAKGVGNIYNTFSG